jgi:hypothetical protein
MIEIAIKRLEHLCYIIPGRLAEINNDTFSFKPAPEKWSKKQILGHLIDSATNNHHRFVRVQFEDEPSIAYDQNKWNEFSFYQEQSKEQLITFWAAYNRQLIEILRNIPPDRLSRKCKVRENVVTLDFLINDYVEHLEHHLHQLVEY